MNKYSEANVGFNDILLMEFSSGESVESYAEQHGLIKAMDKVFTEGVKGRDIKQIPGEFEALEGTTQEEIEEELKAASFKYASELFDIIDSLSIFFKRILQEDILISENQLIGSTENEEEDENYRKYEVIFTIEDINRIFSDILGYPVDLDEEDDIESFLTSLLVNLKFEDSLFLIFSNSDKNKIIIEKAGELIEIPVDQSFFTLEKVELENNNLQAIVNFKVEV